MTPGTASPPPGRGPWLSFALIERMTAFVDLLVAVVGFALCALGTYIYVVREDKHTAVWGLIAAIVLFPATMAAVLAWLSLRRRAEWRWWIQPLPYVALIAMNYTDLEFLDSAWGFGAFLGVPLAVVASYALYGARRLPGSRTDA